MSLGNFLTAAGFGIVNGVWKFIAAFGLTAVKKLFEDIRYHLGKLVHITAAGGNSWKIVLFLLNAVKSCDSYLLRNLYPSLAEHFADSYCHRIVYADYCFGKTVGVIKKALHYLLGGIGIEAAVAETLILKRNAMLSQHLLVYCLTPFGNAVALYARNAVYLSKMVLFRQMIYQLIKSVGLIKKHICAALMLPAVIYNNNGT